MPARNYTINYTTTGGRPDATNTGYDGGSLTSVGDLTLTAANVATYADSGSGTSGDPWVVEDVSATRITVNVDHVTIRNFLVSTGNQAYAIKQDEGFTGMLLEDGEITGEDCDAAVVWYAGTLRRLNIHHLGADGLKPRGPSLTEACYVHHLGMGLDAHADGVQIRTSDDSAIADVVLRGNNFDMPHPLQEPSAEGFKSNACVFVQCPTPGFVAEDNWFNGGGYCVGIGAGGLYRNNRFGRKYQNGLWWSSSSSDWTAETWINNRWDDTDEVIPQPD